MMPFTEEVLSEPVLHKEGNYEFLSQVTGMVNSNDLLHEE